MKLGRGAPLLLVILGAALAVGPAAVDAKPSPKKTPRATPRTPNSDLFTVPLDAAGSFESQPINGKTIDFDYDGSDIRSKSRAYEGRVFIPTKVLEQGKPVPMVVFFHGLNKALTPHRWMGGGQEGDIRRIILEMVDAGDIPPVIIAGPGSIEPAAVSEGSSFPVFDFDKFVYLSRKAIAGIAEIDETRIIVSGHSGAGCTATGGLGCGTVAKDPPYAIISIDTCMNVGLAQGLGVAHPSTHVIAVYQSGAWDRDFDEFERTFEDLVAKHPPNAGVMRLMDEVPTDFHDYTPTLTYQKWLPALLGTPARPF